MIYTTTDLNGQWPEDQTLLIGVGMTSNKLAVVDTARRLRFAASYDPARPAPEVTAVLDRPYAAVKLAVADCRYMLIPADVYDERQHDVYLRYLPFDGVGTMQVAPVAALGVKLLYQANHVGTETLAARFPDAEHYPQVQSLLSAITAEKPSNDDLLVAVERHGTWMTVVVFDRRKLLYCHDFECTTEDDFTYHLITVLRQFGLADRQPAIVLAGDLDQGDAYHGRAAAYGGKVLSADSRWAGIEVPDDVVPHAHRFLSLFGLYQCES